MICKVILSILTLSSFLFAGDDSNPILSFVKPVLLAGSFFGTFSVFGVKIFRLIRKYKKAVESLDYFVKRWIPKLLNDAAYSALRSDVAQMAENFDDATDYTAAQLKLIPHPAAQRISKFFKDLIKESWYKILEKV